MFNTIVLLLSYSPLLVLVHGLQFLIINKICEVFWEMDCLLSYTCAACTGVEIIIVINANNVVFNLLIILYSYRRETLL